MFITIIILNAIVHAYIFYFTSTFPFSICFKYDVIKTASTNFYSITCQIIISFQKANRNENV